MRFFRGFASQTRGKLAAVRAVFAQALVLRAQGKYDCELPTGGREDDARLGSAFVSLFFLVPCFFHFIKLDRFAREDLYVMHEDIISDIC